MHNVPTTGTLQSSIQSSQLHSAPAPIDGVPGQDDYKNTQDYKELFDFAIAQPLLKALIQEFDKEVSATEKRRKTRKIDIDVVKLRESGKIDQDETFIPVRVIDTNIKREQPPFISYLQSSRRIAIFKCLDKPTEDTQELENQYTTGMTYSGWQIPFHKELDGAQTHGWDSIEVIYDETKPFNVGVEHIGHDKLIFSLDAIDLQACSRILRGYDITLSQAQTFVEKFGWSKEQVDKLVSARKNTKSQEKTLRVYKKYCKYSGIVNVAWFCITDGVNDWLKAPMPAYVGIRRQIVDEQATAQQAIMSFVGAQPNLAPQQPVMKWEDAPLTQYPIFILPYLETEEQKIADHKGRVYLDGDKQEAMTAITSAFVNGITRASKVFGSPSQDSGDGTTIKVLENVKLSNGTILNKPFVFFNMPYPDPSVLRALQYLDVSNQQESGQVNYAVQNRQDSRKTAKEISVAQEQQQQLGSVQVVLFSTHCRQVQSFIWLIVQSQSLQDKITLLPTFGPNGEPLGNNKELLGLNYDVRPSGDVDVIERQEKIQKMQTFWPVVATTALAIPFLIDILKVAFPEDSDRYGMILEQAAQQQAVMPQVMSMMQGAMERLKTNDLLPPEEEAAMKQMAQVAMQSQQPQQEAQPVAAL